MTKPRLLYVSPFTPMKSGISDYSQILVYGLAKYFNITILIDNYKLSDKRLYKDFDVKIYGRGKINFNNYEYKIYNIGNNYQFHSYIYKIALENPGMIILHDYILYHFFLGYYHGKENFFSNIYENNGSIGIYYIKNAIKKKKDLSDIHLAAKLPCNKEILLKSKKIMVHSLYNFNKIKDIVQNNIACNSNKVN